MAELIWSDEAGGSLGEIHAYLAGDDHIIAESTVRGIICKTDLLRNFPGPGPRLQGYEGASLSALIYGHYRIIYRQRSNEVIELVGIVHQAMDLNRRLGSYRDENKP